MHWWNIPQLRPCDFTESELLHWHFLIYLLFFIYNISTLYFYLNYSCLLLSLITLLIYSYFSFNSNCFEKLVHSIIPPPISFQGGPRDFYIDFKRVIKCINSMKFINFASITKILKDLWRRLKNVLKIFAVSLFRWTNERSLGNFRNFLSSMICNIKDWTSLTVVIRSFEGFVKIFEVF